MYYNTHILIDYTYRKKDQKMNKTIIAISVSLILTACGSGGSGSGVSGSYSPSTNPTNNTNENRHSQATPTPVSTSMYQQEALADKQAAQSGGKAKVLLMDTGVNLNANDVKQNKVSHTMSVYNSDTDTIETQNTKDFDASEHGTRMAKVIQKHASDTDIVVSSYNPNSNTGIVDVFATAADTYHKQSNIDIVNNSYSDGSSENSRKYVEHQGTLNNLHYIVDNGAIMFFAAGNGTNANPNNSAMIAYHDKTLQKGIVTVAGVHDGQMIYNRCGKAKDFCISAEAYHEMSASSGSGRVITTGTSSATAYVSSVAAKIKTRYDWMKNEQIRDVLFTTATDAGVSGVDDVYGVGIMNADKALNGYGRFDKQTPLEVDGLKSKYYFDNDITGSGALTKNGNSSLVLNGNNTFNGTNIINRGKLILNGKNAAQNVVNQNGVLSVGDNTTITSGSIENNGKVEAITTSDLNINGNFVNNKTGVVDKAIGSTIKVSGEADIRGGQMNVTGVAKGYVTKNGKTENLLTAQQIKGQFDNINVSKVSDLVKNTVDVSDNAISVKTSRQEVGAVALPQSDYVGKATSVNNVDKLLNQLDAKVETGNQLSDAEARIAGEILSSQNITQTMFELGTETAKHAIVNASQNEVKQNNTFVQDVLTQDGVWINYGYNKSKLHLNGLRGESSDNSLTIGYAYNFGKQKVGVAATRQDYSWKEQFNNVSKSTNTDGYGVDLAYVYNVNGYNLMGFTGYNWLRNRAFGRADMRQYHFGLGVNRMFAINEKWYIMPTLTLQYINTKAKDLTVANDVSVKGSSNKQTVVSVNVDNVYKLNDKVALLGNVGIEQDLRNKNHYVDNYAGNEFENKDSTIGKTRYNVGLGVSYKPTENINMSLIAKHEQGRHWKNNSVNFKVGYKF